MPKYTFNADIVAEFKKLHDEVERLQRTNQLPFSSVDLSDGTSTTLVDTAQAIEGKTQTFYQDSTNVPTARSINDVWYVTDMGNLPRIWQGDALGWVDLPLSGIAVVTTDLVAPTTSPMPTVLGGLNQIFLSWASVENADPVTYDIHLSTTTGFAPDATTLVMSASSTLVSLKQLPDGTPLAYDTVYYFRIIARDADGSAPAGPEASGSMDRSASDDIVAGSITAAHLSAIIAMASAFTTRSFDSSGNMVGQGTTIGMVGPNEAGIRSYDSDNQIRFDLPDDPDLPAIFRGNAEIDHLTVKTLTTLLATSLAQSSTFTLENAVREPSQPPLISVNYNTLELQTTSDIHDWYGFTSDGTNFYNGNRVNADSYVQKWNATTGVYIGRTTTVVGFAVTNCVFAGGNLYAIGKFTTGAWYVYRYNASTLAFIDRALWSDADGTAYPAIGWDATSSELMIAQSSPSNADKVVVRRYTYNTATNTLVASATAAWISTNAYQNNLSTILYGSFDFGSPRYIYKNFVTYTTSWIVNNTDGSFDTGGWWDIGMDAPIAGLHWNGSQFLGLDRSNTVTYYEAGNKWTTDTDATWYAAYSWYNNTSLAQTPVGPITRFTMKKRARLTVTTGTLAAGVDTARIFLSKGTTVPGAASTMTYQGSTATGSRLVTAAIFTPLNNVSVNGFGSGVPAAIQSDIGDGAGKYIKLQGNGAGRAGFASWNSSGQALQTILRRSSTTNQSITTSNWTAVSMGGTAAYDSGDMITGGILTIPATGIYNITARCLWVTDPTGRRVIQVESFTSEAVGSGSVVDRNDATSSGVHTSRIATDVFLTAGTQIRLVAWQNSGGAVALDHSTLQSHFNIRRVG